MSENFTNFAAQCVQGCLRGAKDVLHGMISGVVMWD